MAKTEHPPSIKKTAFSCPHCGAYTTQTWIEVYGKQISNEQRKPFIVTKEIFDNNSKRMANEHEIPNKIKREYLDDLQNLQTGNILLKNKENSYWNNLIVENLFLSSCYNCHKISVWVYDRLVYPDKKEGIEPNQDLPGDIIRDYEEARSIVTFSPRGAAALLRLAVQKICVHLGEKGNNLNDDIASLVKKGLNPKIQKSLDIVRVIGNNAVHPAELNFRDDRDTATKLFTIVNLIADQMISHPNEINKLYDDKIPPEKKNAIEKRDTKSKKL